MMIGVRSWLISLVAVLCTSGNVAAFAPPYSHQSNVMKPPSNEIASVSSTLQSLKVRDPPFSSTTALKGMWSGDDGVEGVDRIKSCIPYILPLLDGDQFGRYIYMRIPPLGAAHSVLFQPLVNLYHAVPFLGLGLFVALTLGTRNSNMSRSLRYNAQQAALIDVALIFPELLSNAVDGQPIPRYIAEPSSNFVFYTYMAMIIYSIWSNLSGKKPNQIPVISEAAEAMVGPF